MLRAKYILIAMLVACVVGMFVTRDASAPGPPQKKNGAEISLIDQRLMQTARQMAGLADSSQEQEFAAEALRLADHELDQAYATALREAAEPGQTAVPPQLQQLTARIAKLRADMVAEQQKIAQLTKDS